MGLGPRTKGFSARAPLPHPGSHRAARAWEGPATDCAIDTVCYELCPCPRLGLPPCPQLLPRYQRVPPGRLQSTDTVRRLDSGKISLCPFHQYSQTAS